MSLNVLVVCEDHTYDQYVVRPLVQAMLRQLGRPQARVQVYRGFHGRDECLDWARLRDVLDAYRGQVQLFVLCVDRDGDAGRHDTLALLERRAEADLPRGRKLLAEAAWQEIEVWALAGQSSLPAAWSWQAIRAEPHSKERYFEPFVASTLGPPPGPGGAWRVLGEEAGRRYDRVRQLCPEDVGRLEQRTGEWLAVQAT